MTFRDNIYDTVTRRYTIMQVDVQEAQTQITTLIDKVKAGEEISFAENGKVVAKLIPLSEPEGEIPDLFDEKLPKESRKPGGMKGEIWISPDFDAPLPDEIARPFGMID
ncbi:MAG: hypothetical protein C4527_12195 [Candidatus Omnitrophota bacterium]|nr:MAG: hypothetical protein C4527_12195 [Candidatus Omnitrophota bacterium]